MDGVDGDADVLVTVIGQHQVAAVGVAGAARKIAAGHIDLDAVSGTASSRYEAAWAQASTRARGGFADTLDALTVALHEQAQQSVRRGADRAALAASQAIEAVEVAKERIASNVSPQLITVNLLRELQELLS